MRIAIQGELGSNSHLASEALLGEQILLSCALSAEVFERLAVSRIADAAVLPIENSLHGAVADHYDLLLEHDVAIVGETALRIRHALIAVPGSELQQIRRVLSHPVALSQCRRFFLHNPQIEAIPFHDTAGAARHAIQSGDPAVAAIAAPGAAQIFGGTILQRDLEDDPQNFTRFFLLARTADTEAVRAAAQNLAAPDRLSLAFAIPHRPGSLVSALQRLADTGADLTRIESRPVPGRPWEYVFFVDLRLNEPEDADIALHALHSGCTWAKVLGRYGLSANTANMGLAHVPAWDSR